MIPVTIILFILFIIVVVLLSVSYECDLITTKEFFTYILIAFLLLKVFLLEIELESNLELFREELKTNTEIREVIK